MNYENKTTDELCDIITKEIGVPIPTYSYEYPQEGGWTGGFEYTFNYQKPGDHWCTTSYVLNCEEVIPYKI